MKVAKMLEWGEAELAAKEQEFSDQLFRLKFKLASGQSSVLAKLRELRKDIARVKTLRRQQELEAQRAKDQEGASALPQ